VTQSQESKTSAFLAWSRLTDFRKAKSGKPDDAKSWVCNHKIIYIFVIMIALPQAQGHG
jgi:hypothetical protein